MSVHIGNGGSEIQKEETPDTNGALSVQNVRISGKKPKQFHKRFGGSIVIEKSIAV